MQIVDFFFSNLGHPTAPSLLDYYEQRARPAPAARAVAVAPGMNSRLLRPIDPSVHASYETATIQQQYKPIPRGLCKGIRLRVGSPSSTGS